TETQFCRIENGGWRGQLSNCGACQYLRDGLPRDRCVEYDRIEIDAIRPVVRTDLSAHSHFSKLVSSRSGSKTPVNDIADRTSTLLPYARRLWDAAHLP